MCPGAVTRILGGTLAWRKENPSERRQQVRQERVTSSNAVAARPHHRLCSTTLALLVVERPSRRVGIGSDRLEARQWTR